MWGWGGLCIRERKGAFTAGDVVQRRGGPLQAEGTTGPPAASDSRKANIQRVGGGQEGEGEGEGEGEREREREKERVGIVKDGIHYT